MKQTIKNQRLFFISLIGIVAVSLIMGTTYAYQTLTVEKTEGSDTTVTLNVGKLNVTFDLKCKDNETCDENNDNYDRINLSNMPLSSTYKNSDYVEFTLNTNDSTDDVAYQINLTEIDYGYITNGTKTQGCNNDSCIIDENFKYTVVEVVDNQENILSEGNFSDLSGTEYTLQLQSGIYNSINKGKSQTVRLYLWLKETNENQNNLENTYFNAKIEINSYFLHSLTPSYEEGTMAYKLLENAANVTLEQEETLGYAILRPTPLTKPAEETSNETESSLSLALDDHGISYYYRGNVKNNYVNFAGMCWRIVRIAGDGTAKLILEDQYTTCDDTETETTSAVYTGNWNIGTGNYGYEEKNVDSDSSNEYIMSYLKPVTNADKSMVKAFYDFQTTKLADYTGKLKSGDWCLGDKAYIRSGSSGSYTYTLLEEYNYTSIMYYDAYTRLKSENANGYQPTLKCNGTILNEFADVSGVSNEAPMYVSAITADEIVYAGGKYEESNYNYYLMNNYSKDIYYFCSLSPGSFYGTDDVAFCVNLNGRLNLYDVDYYVEFRPSVSLASSVSVTDAKGAIDDPYVIE